MATAEAIDQLRLLIAELDEENYSDSALSDRLDSSASVFSLAAAIWNEKAAAAASLVDTSEGGSSRKMGDLYEQYKSMAATMRDEDAALAPSGRGVVIRKLRRA